MPKLTLNNITSGFTSTTALNAAFDAIEAAMENTVSRNGLSPNTMSADLDMNGKRILNQLAQSGDGFIWKGVWVTATTYAVNNLVYNSGKSYICTVAHTSGTFGTDLSAVKWELLADQGAAGAGTGDMLKSENLSGLANNATARANLGAQTVDATLTAIAAVVNAADQINYATGPDAFSPTPLTAFARTLLDDADAATARATLELVTVAQAEAEAGTATTTRTWTAERVKQAITALAGLQVLHVRDEKAATVAGGASVVGNQTRTLNTVVKNTITGASLATNDITLPAGTYSIYASAPAIQTASHRLRLFNVTDTSVTLLGSSIGTNVAAEETTVSVIIGEFTITGTKVFRLTHYIATAVATLGLGNSAGDTFINVYTEAYIRKLA